MIKAYTHLNQILTLEGAHKKNGRHLIHEDLNLIEDGAVVFDSDKIIWVGSTKDLPSKYHARTINLEGHILTPELVDSHTHLIFGGDRASEYSERLSGISYEEIAKRGGGILKTMHDTRKSSAQELFDKSCETIKRMKSYGIGTIEIKSGYGLELKKEREISLIIHQLKKEFEPDIQIFNTFMAAHDVPSHFSSSDDYLNQVVLPLLEELGHQGIIDSVDIFHEKNYFTKSDVIKLFQKAREFSIPLKTHADELNDNHGASLAAELNALSADHLLKINEKGIEDLAHSKTVATLLPGTAFFLGKPLAPAQLLFEKGCQVAIASDYNPGSCHCDNLLLIASMSAAQLKLSQVQLWTAITLNASHALGLSSQGAIVPGLKPRFSLFQVPSISHITYHWGRNFSVTLP